MSPLIGLVISMCIFAFGVGLTSLSIGLWLGRRWLINAIEDRIETAPNLDKREKAIVRQLVKRAYTEGGGK